MNNNPKAESDPPIARRPLAFAWCLWERYQEALIKNSTNYDRNLQVIYTFDTLEQFALLWKYTTYSSPSQLFFDCAKEATKKFKVFEEDPDEKIVEGLFLFKEGVEPKWEDPANQRGCSIFCDIQSPSAEQIDQLWRDLAFAVVGQNFPHSECVNGFRVLDRLKKYNTMKLELWLSKGMAGHKSGSEEYQRNVKTVDVIIEHFHGLVNRTQAISILDFIKKDHFVASMLK